MPSRAMGDRLRELREKAGLSQAEVAERAGVPLGTLRGWEYGRREPLLSAAGQLAVALGVEVGELLKAPESEEESQTSTKHRGRPRKAPPVDPGKASGEKPKKRKG
jgi:transcriptional regulator with XRE-family HTH domain